MTLYALSVTEGKKSSKASSNFVLTFSKGKLYNTKVHDNPQHGSCLMTGTNELEKKIKALKHYSKQRYLHSFVSVKQADVTATLRK